MNTTGTYKQQEALCYNKGFIKSMSERWNFEMPNVPYIKNNYENRIAYTWMKNFAKIFNSEVEANSFAKENRIDYYTILNFENAKNH
jgi:hypothetical protein